MINNAAAYATWRQQVLTMPENPPTAAAAVMIQRAIIELLATDQFYGEVLTRLPRQTEPQLTAPFALIWQANRLCLQFAAQPLAQTFTRFDELQAGLKHVALHVIWQHPLRYRQQVQSQPQLVQLATDLAVNQYVSGLPKGSPQLATIQPTVAVPLPIKADSQVYLRLLQSAAETSHTTGDTTASADKTRQQANPQPAAGAGTAQTMIDSPHSWQATTGQLTNPNLAQARLQQLTQTAWQQTTLANRGLVAGQIVTQLQVTRQPAALDWRRLLATGIGQMPVGKRPSRARFNRRQPTRMELPGQISDPQLQVRVYVDHSGSISDTTLQYLLSQVATLTQAIAATITVSTFDAVVQPGQVYQANLPQQIRFTRVGGGGTVYQSIFDDLKRCHATNRTTLALILTDGQGERTVVSHGFTNVIWLLATAHDRLSVQPVIGRVVTFKPGEDHDDDTFKAN
ncbi:vWA domain-containing protein [Lactiplantibacillus daowaiensis]|uniref:VWA-like domain-containing protein n=1 Tax=Lactiplantibacillus daowaiensis TaxID=2559918 RepID=A0ABW1S1Y1_9LACO|nr:VWA-like domain-containing protein [Lactiplantibacillus daowaiensis]